MSLKPLQSATIHIEPSKKLYHFISKIDIRKPDIPEGVLAIRQNRKTTQTNPRNIRDTLLLTPNDRNLIKSLKPKLEDDSDIPELNTPEEPTDSSKSHHNIKHPLTISDIRWLHDYIVECNKNNKPKVYLHELFEGSEVALPKNEEQPRDAELEKRCVKLRAQQENMQYNAMTKHIDSVRKRHPEDSIAYQVREMDKYLIVVAQFVMSVAAGFAFGFLGIPLLVYGTIDFGVRLLLGIVSALIIAIAELYFVLRKMDRDSAMEEALREKAKKTN